MIDSDYFVINKEKKMLITQTVAIQTRYMRREDTKEVINSHKGKDSYSMAEKENIGQQNTT